MKRTSLIVTGFALLLLASSCAPLGPKYSVLKPSFTPVRAEMGRVFFYRPVGFGGGVRPVIKLNGKEIGESMPMAFFYLDLPPDNYTAEVTTEVTRKASFTLAAGEVKFIRFHVTMGFFIGHVNPEIVSEKLALEELEKCSYSMATAECKWEEAKPADVFENCRYSPKPKSVEKAEGAMP